MSAVDHVNVKIFARPGSQADWHALIPVFHRWIRENVLPGTLIDVADYGHVPEGPGVLLIGHEAFYSVDNRAGELGFLYNQRVPAGGDTASNVKHSYEAAVNGARLLERETALQFDDGRFEIFVNDRVLGPNTENTEAEVRPVVEELYRSRFGSAGRVERDQADPRRLFRLRVTPAE